MKTFFRNSGLFALVIFAFSLVFSPACGDNKTCANCHSSTEPGPCDLELTEGRGFLMEGNYFMAQDRYLLCLETYPDNVTEYSAAVAEQQKMTAEYGFILAQTLSTTVQLTTTIENLVATAGGILAGGGLNITQTTYPSLNAIVGDLVYGILLKQADYLRPYIYRLLNESPVEPVFQIDDPETEAFESIPVYLGKNNEVLWLSLTGHLDRGELQIIDSFLSMTQGISETMLSINFDVNLNAAVNSVVQTVAGIISGTPIPLTDDLFLGSPDMDSGLVLLPMLTSIAAFTLNNSPAFLTLNNSSQLPLGGGRPLLLDAAGKIGAGCGGFLSAYDWIRNDPDNSTNLFAIVTKDGKEFFRFTFLDPTDAPKVIDIPTRPEFFTSIQNIQNSVTGTGTSPGANPRVSWSRDLSWLLSYGAVFLLQTGGVNALMDITVAKISPSLSTSLKGTINSLTGGTIATPELINGVIQSIIPDAIELDLGYFFHNPTDRYIRNIIPYWTDLGDGDGNGYLILEYECPIPTTYNDANTYSLGVTAYTCPEGTITDTDHFTGLDSNDKPAEIPALPGSIASDNLLANLPYIAWQDPTFNHLLYLNLNGVGCGTCASSFSEPGNWEFNYFTMKLLGSLLSLLQSLGGLT